MKMGIFDLNQYDSVEDNYYTESRTPEGYITRTRIKENKMTREEAKNKLIAVGSLEPDKALEMLEALGLIEFEEKKSKGLIDILEAYMVDWTDCLEELDNNGYKIVPK